MDAGTAAVLAGSIGAGAGVLGGLLGGWHQLRHAREAAYASERAEHRSELREAALDYVADLGEFPDRVMELIRERPLSDPAMIINRIFSGTRRTRYGFGLVAPPHIWDVVRTHAENNEAAIIKDFQRALKKVRAARNTDEATRIIDDAARNAFANHMRPVITDVVRLVAEEIQPRRSRLQDRRE